LQGATKRAEGKSNMNQQIVVQTPRHLYKYLLRQCGRLPEEVQDYYKHSTRAQFMQHAEENDHHRISGIMQQAVKDMDWLLKKYKLEAPSKVDVN